MEDLQELTIKSWDEFRTRYHAQIAASNSGADGLTGLNGAGILQVRSGSHRVAASILSVTDQLNGSGDLPDAESLLSSAVSEGQSLEDFTCMVLSLMFLMDGIYSIHSGNKDMAVRMCKDFLSAGGQPTTAASTPLKTHTPPVTTQSPEQDPVSKAGHSTKKDSTKKKVRSKTKGKQGKARSSRKTSRGRKAPAKKTRKSKRS